MVTNTEMKYYKLDKRQYKKSKFCIEIYRKDILLDRKLGQTINDISVFFKRFYINTVKMPTYSYKVFYNSIELTSEELKGLGW